MAAIEERKQAEKLFRKHIGSESVFDNETETQLLKTIHRLLREGLAKLDKENRFKFSIFRQVIQRTADLGKLVPEKAIGAFENLKLYCILLYKTPWKKEYRKLKTYCGFFQSKIKAHLEDPESIICLIGFEPEKGGSLVLRKAPDQEHCLSVAFECVVAAVECELLIEFHRRMKESGVDIADVVRWRETGELPEPRARKGREYNNGIDSGIDTFSGSSIKSRSLQPTPSRHQTKNLPFIDEGDDNDDALYTEGTIDEHVMASMKRLSHTKKSSDDELKQAPPMRKSDEWGFVTDKLKSKYGNKYFDGERGDLTRNQMSPPDDGSDEGIGEDVGEEPRPVNTHNPPMRPAASSRSRVSYDLARESSGYRTGASSSPVYYPPPNLGVYSPLGSVSPVSPSYDTAYASASYSSQRQPIVRTRAPMPQTLYPSTDMLERRHQIVEIDGAHRPQAYESQNIVISSHSPNTGDFAVTRGMKWTCSKCTLQNDSTTSICVGCAKSRGSPEIDGPQCGESITVCSKCTFENTPGEKNCSMCDTPLEKIVHTYV